MTLIVSAFWRDPATGKVEEFTDWEDGHYMAGVERARQNLWGSEPVRRRGATFLPQLAESDLWVAPYDRETFSAEVRNLLADLDGLRADLNSGPDFLLPHFLDNFLRAAEYARIRGGGVSIT
jgi:hypothetical protein